VDALYVYTRTHKLTFTAHRVNRDSGARASFHNSTSQWFSTWPTDPKERGLAVKKVRMWQKC
jgi:hypothetical protein